jgi:hypothetical protein
MTWGTNREKYWLRGTSPIVSFTSEVSALATKNISALSRLVIAMKAFPPMEIGLCKAPWSALTVSA